MTDTVECSDKFLHNIVEVKIIRSSFYSQDIEVTDHLDQGWKILKISTGSDDYHLGRPAGVPPFHKVDHRTPEELAHEEDLRQKYGV